MHSKRKKKLLHSFNKLLLLYIYIYAFHNTLVSYNMNLLYNLKVKYLFICIIYSII